MTGFCVDADQDRVGAALSCLQRRRILEVVRRDYSIIVIGGSNQRRRILRARLHVVDGRIGVERLELRLVLFARSVIRNPRRADRELVKAQHIHDAGLLDDCSIKFGPLVRARTHQQSAVRTAVNRQLAR